MTQGFKHIKVNPADDSEVVIIAGAPDAASEEDVRTVDVIVEDREADEPTADENPAVERPADKQPADVKKRSKEDAEDAYHPTTLEDIESSKMPGTQIAVIVVAVIVLVAFGIWFFVLT